MSDSSHNLAEIRRQKRDLRRVMQDRRNDLKTQNPQAAENICRLFLEKILLPSNAIVSGFIPIGSEINPMPLLDALRAKGHAIALPVVTGKGVPLVFRLYNTGDQLVTGVMSLSEPSPDAPVVEPDIILVPLLAFDQRKFRLGYGGGYYDRTLNLLRARKTIIAAGLGFAGQEVPIVPVGSYDAPLDAIVTEKHVFI